MCPPPPALNRVKAASCPRVTSCSIPSGRLSRKRRRTDRKDFYHVPQHHKPSHICEIHFPPNFITIGLKPNFETRRPIFKRFSLSESLSKIKCFDILLESLYHFKVPKKVKIGEKYPKFYRF